MFSVTNAKVAGFLPRWAAFRGFTILFDNPGQSFTGEGPQRRLSTDPAIDFYAGLRDQLTRLDLDLLTSTYLFCPLPPPSYHVTVCDGGNDGNIGQLPASKRDELNALFDGLPESLSSPYELTAAATRSPLVTEPWAIRFRYERLVLWSHSALVAALVPADAESAAQLQRLERDRHDLSAHFQRHYHFSVSECYVPHVTVGYFANRAGAQLALPILGAWESAFGAGMAGKVLTFSRASLYGFTDMATFVTLAAPLG